MLIVKINHYVGAYKSFYISQEGEYAFLVDSPVETTVIEEKKYKTFSAMLLGLELHKDTAKGLHIKADGHIKVTIEEKSSPIHMGDTIIVNGTPKKLYLTEERGTIDRRNKGHPQRRNGIYI